MIRAPAAGRLNRRVRVERPQEVQDDYGDALLTHVLVGERWASVEPISGRERIEASTVSAQVTHRVQMRKGLDLGPRDRIVIPGTGRVLEIESVADLEERGLLLEVLCREAVQSA